MVSRLTVIGYDEGDWDSSDKQSGCSFSRGQPCKVLSNIQGLGNRARLLALDNG